MFQDAIEQLELVVPGYTKTLGLDAQMPNTGMQGGTSCPEVEPLGPEEILSIIIDDLDGKNQSNVRSTLTLLKLSLPCKE